jgi:hypothetical protein
MRPCAVGTTSRPPTTMPPFPPPLRTTSSHRLFLLVQGHVCDRLCNYVCNVSKRAMQCLIKFYYNRLHNRNALVCCTP